MSRVGAMAMQGHPPPPKQPLLKSKYYRKPVKTTYAGAILDDEEEELEAVFMPMARPLVTQTGVNGSSINGTHPTSSRDDGSPADSPLRSAPLLQTLGDNADESAPSGHRHTKSGGQVLEMGRKAVPTRKPVGNDLLRSASVDVSSNSSTPTSDSTRKTSEGGVPFRFSPRTDSLQHAHVRQLSREEEDDDEDIYEDRRVSEEDHRRASWDGDAFGSLQRSDDEQSEPDVPPVDLNEDRESVTPPKLPELKLGAFSWESENVEVRDFAKEGNRPLSKFSVLLESEDDKTKNNEQTKDIPQGSKSHAEKSWEERVPEDSRQRHAAAKPLKKRSPRPSPPPIDTSGRYGQRVRKDSLKKEPIKLEPVKSEPIKPEPVQSEPVKSEPINSEPIGPEPAKSEPVIIEPEKAGPKTPPAEPNDNEEAKSFLWNSPRSSTEDSVKDEQANADAPAREEGARSSTPTKAARPTSADSEEMSANAIGFGAGPSDWEFLGDYGGEEVDDIHLYTSPKTQDAPPIQPPPINTAIQDLQSNGEFYDADDSPSLSRPPYLERKILSTIEERHSENLEDLLDDNAAEQRGETIDTRAVFGEHPPPPPPDDGSRESGSNLLPPATDDSFSRESVASSTDTMGRISFHVPLPPESATSESSSKDSPAQYQPDEGKGILSFDDSAPKEPEDPPLGPESTTPKPVIPEDAAVSSIPRVISASPSVKTTNSSRMISRASDDGKEEIMISLEVPRGTPPPVIPESEERSPGLNRTRESQHTPDLLRSGRRSIYPGTIELENPYDGLEVWAKASLNRFIKNLHDEARATTNEEKYQVFLNLMRNEQRIRAVFYDQDEESDGSDTQVKQPKAPTPAPPPPAPIEEPKVSPQPQLQPPNSAGIRISKALPALPTEHEHTPVSSPIQATSEGAAHSSGKVSLRSLDASSKPATSAGEVVVDPPADSSETSTGDSAGGGDNAAKQLKDKAMANLPGASSLNALRKALDIVTNKKNSLTPKDSQALARASLLRAAGQPNREEFKSDDRNSGGVASPTDGVTDAQQASETASLDDQPGELSPREGKPYEGDKAANRQSMYQPFSNMLRASSVRSGPSEAGDWRKSHQGQHSIRDSAHGTDGLLSPAKTTRPANIRHTILEPLVVVVPQDSILRKEPEPLTRLRSVMDTIPDDFSFIHKTVLAWDAEAKKARERYESERHVRQGQNEQRIDELFNEHEIGYSDISRLEADFKRAEAAKKAEEDREEVNTFVSSVFDNVWARINYEIDQLKPLYDECTHLVADASAGRGMFEEDNTRVPIAPAMEALLILYQKLMVRHQKAFEAVLERDRRLKKVEQVPWYTLGAMDKVKRIERRFEDAEKKAILDFCRQRDERANLLMDVLDQNTLRGVGANQDYMESVMHGVRQVTADLARGGDGAAAVGADDVVSTTEVLKAQTVTTALARSSEQIVQTFHVADMLLNAADYEVSVANAKLIGADAAAFRRLRDAKAKEDQKLALDLEHRMGLIRGDTQRTQDEITTLLRQLQDRQGQGSSGAATTALAAASNGLDDPAHAAALRTALEASVVATKNGQGSGGAGA